MKAFLLTATALLACAGSMFAQNLPPDYNWEIGINGGVSAMTRPLGPANAYQGTRSNLVHDFSARLDYYVTPNWMLHLDIGDRKWETYGNWQPQDKLGQALNPVPVSFLEADHAISESVALNYVIPFSTMYGTFTRANLYFGVTVGMINTINDGSLAYSKYNHAPDSSYIYTSRYDYGSGAGYNFGVQVGYTYYILPRLGVNVELAARYAHVKTIDEHYGSENDKFYLLYFPETIGVRWRF